MANNALLANEIYKTAHLTVMFLLRSGKPKQA